MAQLMVEPYSLVISLTVLQLKGQSVIGNLLLYVYKKIHPLKKGDATTITQLTLAAGMCYITFHILSIILCHNQGDIIYSLMIWQVAFSLRRET